MPWLALVDIAAVRRLGDSRIERSDVFAIIRKADWHPFESIVMRITARQSARFTMQIEKKIKKIKRKKTQRCRSAKVIQSRRQIPCHRKSQLNRGERIKPDAVGCWLVAGHVVPQLQADGPTVHPGNPRFRVQPITRTICRTEYSY